MCKRGATFSLAVLIGRGLDFVSFRLLLFFLCSVFRVCLVYAPLAQLVEHLTLNRVSRVRVPEGVPYGPLVKRFKTPASHAGNMGSNPVRVTKENSAQAMYDIWI